jgi:hypothetical protein
LLTERRNALVHEFRRLGASVLESIDLLDRDAADAGRQLRLSIAGDGHQFVASAALAAADEVEVNVTTRRVAGVPIVEVHSAPVVRARTARGYSLTATSAHIDAVALRETAAARDEVPGRRGYPGYMYSDLASLFERAGRIRGRRGSVTQVPVLSMPDDDVTHPIPDVTAYITEGQIVLSRELDRRGIVPPIDILPSLSRLMNAGIGEGSTRADHRGVADQISAFLGRGHEVRRLIAIVGEQGLSDDDRRVLAFVDELEQRFIGQGDRRRSVEATLDLAWELLSRFPADELKRIKPALVERHHPGTRSPLMQEGP